MKNIFLLLSILLSINTFSQSEYFITSADQTKLHVREFGSGEPLIFLAGGPGLNADYLEAIWGKLSSDYRCIVLDQRGTGKSILPKVDSVSLTMENYVSDLEALRNHLKLEQITLIGHSWGGMLAMEYVSKKHKSVKNLILLNPGGPTSNFFSYFSDNIQMRLHAEDTREAKVLDSLGKSDLRAIFPGYFFDRDRALALKEIWDFDSIFGQPGVMGNTFSNFISTQKDRVSHLKNYTGIVHIIQGRQDPIGESTVYEIKELLPQSQVTFIEKCGHFPWLENGDQVAEFFKVLHSALN